MRRLVACGLILMSLAVVAAQPARQRPEAAAFSVVEASIGDMRAALEQRRVTSHALVQQSLDRIARYESRLNAAITVNPTRGIVCPLHVPCTRFCTRGPLDHRV